MEAQLKGAVLIALVLVPQRQCPILKPLSAKLPPIQDGRMVQFYNRGARTVQWVTSPSRGFVQTI